MVDPISAVLMTLTVGVDSASLLHQKRDAEADGGVEDIGGVKEFWQAHRQGSLEAGSYVSIDGTLSEFAPMLFGDPRQVKRRHFELRDSLSDEAPAVVDALVSISSGNPVVRLAPMQGVYYMGLYDSIGRNSIPIFVDADVFESWHADRDDRQVWDVTVTGKLDDLPLEWGDFFSIFGIDDEAAEYALYVHADDDVSGIEYHEETRFFEADAWAAYTVDDETNWITRCPDFADRSDRRHSLETMIDVLESREDATLVSQYDLVDKPLTSGTSVDDSATTVQEVANKRVREGYVDEIQSIIEEYTT
ncbi:hypothetical protein [Halobacterium sp. KA-6]|uniref:hypothetical protein n=1 Tax=Halobacterium sp. KA-6 TaxID=2896368 RepID=UPI001E4076C9|nr:hypothetical protein [Halobacterium sp. KA-6]MCD2204227.1 hypothetical protein [Halobacterium sp. KA-6]